MSRPGSTLSFVALLAGAAQLAGIVYRFGSWLGNAPVLPTWNQDAEFRALRPGRR